jgi:hypothetical protein
MVEKQAIIEKVFLRKSRQYPGHRSVLRSRRLTPPALTYLFSLVQAIKHLADVRQPITSRVVNFTELLLERHYQRHMVEDPSPRPWAVNHRSGRGPDYQNFSENFLGLAHD